MIRFIPCLDRTGALGKNLAREIEMKVFTRHFFEITSLNLEIPPFSNFSHIHKKSSDSSSGS